MAFIVGCVLKQIYSAFQKNNIKYLLISSFNFSAFGHITDNGLRRMLLGFYMINQHNCEVKGDRYSNFSTTNYLNNMAYICIKSSMLILVNKIQFSQFGSRSHPELAQGLVPKR